MVVMPAAVPTIGLGDETIGRGSPLTRAGVDGRCQIVRSQPWLRMATVLTDCCIQAAWLASPHHVDSPPPSRSAATSGLPASWPGGEISSSFYSRSRGSVLQ